MRTALVFSALLIIDAINGYKSFMYLYSEEVQMFMGACITIFIFADIIDLFKKYDVKIEAYYEPSYCENEFCDAAHPEYILKPKKFREVRMTSIYREFEEK